MKLERITKKIDLFSPKILTRMRTCVRFICGTRISGAPEYRTPVIKLLGSEIPTAGIVALQDWWTDDFVWLGFRFFIMLMVCGPAQGASSSIRSSFPRISNELSIHTSILSSGTYRAHIKKTLYSNDVFFGGDHISQNDSSYEESNIAKVRFFLICAHLGLHKRGTTIHDPWNKAEGYVTTQMQNHELSEPSFTGIILRQRAFSRSFFEESSPSECPSFATAGALFFCRVLGCKVRILNSCIPTLSIARCLENRFPFKGYEGKSAVLKSSFSLVPTLFPSSSSSWSIVFSNDKPAGMGTILASYFFLLVGICRCDL